MTTQAENEGNRVEQDGGPVVETITVGLLEANCYVVTCPTTGEILVLDPGAEAERILAALAGRYERVAGILHTHGHFDHIAATEDVLAGLGRSVPVYAHRDDAYLYAPEARAAGAHYGYKPPKEPVFPDRELRDCDEVVVGSLRLEVTHTPGHTPGSISLVCGEHCIFSGDTLFRHGIGRTDLPGGDEEAIYESILTRLYPLAPMLTVYPGHGPATTIEEERRANPFLQAE